MRLAHWKTRVTLESVGPVDVSTVELPNGWFETCLFWGRAPRTSEVVDRYASRGSAIDAHAEWCEPATLARALQRIIAEQG